MMKKYVFALATVAVAASACFMSSSGSGSQGQGSATGCGSSAPTCPQVTPSYATDVSPVLYTYCTGCHQAGGSQSGKPLDSWQGASSLAGKVESKLKDCSMPPSSSPQPSDAERAAIREWIACGAPNN